MYTDLFRYVSYVDATAREEDVEELFMINDYDLFIKFKNGRKVIYDIFTHTFSPMRYGSNDLTDDEYKKEFSEILRKKMNRVFMTQEKLAEHLGTTQQMVSRYVRGESIPSFTMIIKLAKVFNCSTDDFYYKYY